MTDTDTDAASADDGAQFEDLHPTPDWLVRFANFLGIRSPNDRVRDE